MYLCLPFMSFICSGCFYQYKMSVGSKNVLKENLGKFKNYKLSRYMNTYEVFRSNRKQTASVSA